MFNHHDNRLSHHSLAVVLLDHSQHVLLKVKVDRGCGTAHVQMRCHPATKSKVRPKKKYARRGGARLGVIASLAEAVGFYMMAVTKNMKTTCGINEDSKGSTLDS